MNHFQPSPKMHRSAVMKSQHDRVAMLAGAHDVLGAQLLERCGYDGVWASSLEIAASYGKIDDDRLTMCNVLAVTAAMAGAVSIPVLADVGTGWGDDGDVSRVVSAFESVGAGGICMEDTAYPKCNSLLAGSRRLSNATSFADRISTACAARTNDSFLIFARVEALVAGLGGEEALRRASLYGQAGADAIVIHAKTKCDEEVIEVVRSWQGTAPLVLIPTMYPTLSIDQMESYGTIGFVIYANQGLRAAIGATEAAMRQIQADRHAGGVDQWIAPLGDLLSTQRELLEKEGRDKGLGSRQSFSAGRFERGH
ncbi:isocitrate lyase/PEP mutase family protein [Stieleria sp. ICT_E10.1]|uniref:isocitrate lyase/PEP mutase family protein n=1 Tax=Stieleria sedimenti TaxID=2976331 RepID=UPI00217F7654|nr:isocitrate lyase/PEP mutase family protein [Stieleria sedimenti]MCS7468886.1 isocitrate lyase/PEP mutase family protein [Stieleria sedimenti]